MAEKKKYITIERDGDKCTFTLDGALEEIKIFHEAEENGDEIKLIVTEITEEEFEKLPEHQGW